MVTQNVRGYFIRFRKELPDGTVLPEEGLYDYGVIATNQDEAEDMIFDRVEYDREGNWTGENALIVETACCRLDRATFIGRDKRKARCLVAFQFGRLFCYNVDTEVWFVKKCKLDSVSGDKKQITALIRDEMHEVQFV